MRFEMADYKSCIFVRMFSDGGEGCAGIALKEAIIMGLHLRPSINSLTIVLALRFIRRFSTCISILGRRLFFIVRRLSFAAFLF